MSPVSHAVYPSSVNGVLEIDNAHPVFFDHALDHVPGMLMLVGMLDSIRDAGQFDRPDSQRIHAAVSFSRFAELDAELTIAVTHPDRATPARSWTAQAWQRETIVASADVDYLAPPPAGAEHPPASPLVLAPACPVRPDLVHQNNAENVLLGKPAWTTRTVRMPLLNPPPDHYFARRCRWARGIEEVAEGCRQAAVLLWQLEYDRRSGVQLLLDAVELDLPSALPRVDAAELRWKRMARRGNAAAFSFEVWAPGRSAQPVGAVTIRSRAVTEQAYRRLRSAI